MMVSSSHNGKDSLNEIKRNLIVKKITHRIDEDHARFLPREGKTEGVGMGRGGKAVSVLRLPHLFEAKRHPFGVAVGAAEARFRTAGDGVPA